MSRGTRQRSIRVDDALWEAAQQAADERGDNLSEVLRNALSGYVSGGVAENLLRLADDMEHAISGGPEFIGRSGLRSNASERIRRILNRSQS